MSFLIDLGETEQRFDWLQKREISNEDLNEVKWALRRAIYGSIIGGFSIFSSLSIYRTRGGFRHYEVNKAKSTILSVSIPIIGLTSSAIIFAVGLYFFFKTTDRMYFKYKRLEDLRAEEINMNQSHIDLETIESQYKI